MADVKKADEGTEFPEKRKIDVPKSINEVPEEETGEADSNKRQKVDTTTSAANGAVSLPAGENVAECGDHLNDGAAVEDEENSEQEEDANGEVEDVDRKGKGVLIDRKGKGKMIEDSEDDDSDGDDDSDDSSDDSDGDFSDGLDDSDLESDPLAEVDLDNILPSRTRQRSMQPGLRIFDDSDKGNNA
ncbi:hypothetical protein ACP275_02G124100 [Erythranthe tilingii]